MVLANLVWALLTLFGVGETDPTVVRSPRGTVPDRGSRRNSRPSVTAHTVIPSSQYSCELVQCTGSRRRYTFGAASRTPNTARSLPSASTITSERSRSHPGTRAGDSAWACGRASAPWRHAGSE